MTPEEALAVSVRQLRVSSTLLIEEYARVQSTGEFADPQLAVAALHEVDKMVTFLLLAGLDKVRYDGSHVNRLLEMGDESKMVNVQENSGSGEEK